MLPVSLSVTTHSEENHVPTTLLLMLVNQTATERERRQRRREGARALKCEINVPRYPGQRLPRPLFFFPSPLFTQRRRDREVRPSQRGQDREEQKERRVKVHH